MAQANPGSLFGEEPDDDSFWLKLMAECLENPVTKLPAGRKLLVLGDNEAEKTMLVTKMQGGAECQFTRGNGLEYRYISVKDEYCDSHTKLGVWILDGDPFYKPLLKYALDESSLADTTVLLVASMTKPWDLLDTIITWTEILREHIESLDMPPGELQERKNKVLERFREYVEPGLSVYGSLAADTTRELPVNLGVELVVVIARTEHMKELQTEHGYEEEHFDFIQLRLREFCLRHGAALFYASAREDRNCDLLLKYALHRAYAFPFRLPAVLVERESVLVPAGWDTRNKIRFLTETLSALPPSTPYGEVVFRPARLADRERAAPEVVARRDQEFLAEMRAALERGVSEDRAAESAREAPSSMTATVVQRNVARRMTRAQSSGRSPQKKAEAKLVTGEGDNTLSNFFHSLLNRRTSAPVDRPLGIGGGRTLASKHNSERDSQSKESRNLRGISEQSAFGGRKSCSEESSDSSEENRNESNPNATSLDPPPDKGPLPEYFLSHPGPCAPDCSFQRQQSSDSFDAEDEFSLSLDRVRSSFNPPLRLLLEGPDLMPMQVPANGEVRDPAHRDLSRTDGVSIKDPAFERDPDGSSGSFISELVKPFKDAAPKKDPAASDLEGNSVLERGLDGSSGSFISELVRPARDTTLKKDVAASDLEGDSVLQIVPDGSSGSFISELVRPVQDKALRKDSVASDLEGDLVLERGPDGSSGSFVGELVRPVKNTTLRKDPAASDQEGDSVPVSPFRLLLEQPDPKPMDAPANGEVVDPGHRDLTRTDSESIKEPVVRRVPCGNSSSFISDLVRPIVKDPAARKDLSASDLDGDSVPVPPDTVMSSMPLKMNGHDQNSEDSSQNLNEL